MAEQEEVGDHGILGGYVLFDRLYSSEVKPISLKKNLMRNIYDLESPHDGLEYHLERIPLYQDICYRIMEHNIWKNKDNFAEDHPFYEIKDFEMKNNINNLFRWGRTHPSGKGILLGGIMKCFE